MKIKKTDTYGKISLLVGLLSFNTLSSCVNTGRVLGIRGQSHTIRINDLEERIINLELWRINNLEQRNQDNIERYGLARSRQSLWYKQNRHTLVILRRLGLFIGGFYYLGLLI